MDITEFSDKAETRPFGVKPKEAESSLGHFELNAMLNVNGGTSKENFKINFDSDKEAAHRYFLDEINPNTVFFHTLREKLDYLVDEGYYDAETLNMYDFDFIKKAFQHAYSYKFRFDSFMGAYKFYQQYALKTNDGKHYLERYEDRVVMNALYLARGDENTVLKAIDNIITHRIQPATPTFLNAGKAQRGELVSCFLLLTSDSMEAIGRTVLHSLQLSKRGGGVGILLTDIREEGAPIKYIENQSSGIIPVMKLLEDSFSYANQLGARQGAGAVYLSVHHPDFMKMLDSKRENADEKIRIKTLSIGAVLSDRFFKEAARGNTMYQFSPYDVLRVYGKPMSSISISDKYDEMVEDDRIKKYKVNPRKILATIAELQFESGYPYLLFEDTANQFTPNNLGHINMSNLCSEIIQHNEPSVYSTVDESIIHEGKDISCNLASMNIASTMHLGGFGDSVNLAVRMLTAVSDITSIGVVSSVRKGNEMSHSIGLGAMNLHGFLGSEEIEYGSDESLDFVNAYFATMRYFALQASSELAKEKGETYEGFDTSDYIKGTHGEHSEALYRYVEGIWRTTPQTEKIKQVMEKYNFWTPTPEDWAKLEDRINEDGLYNAYLMANAPTGSISYISSSTSSLHPVASRVEARKEGKIGRVYYAAPGMTDDNTEFFKDAYEIGPHAIIDVYAALNKHVDQSSSLTLFIYNTNTTADLNKAYLYAMSKKNKKNANGEKALDDPELAWKNGIVKSLYYTRVKSNTLEGTEYQNNINECTSCQI